MLTEHFTDMLMEHPDSLGGISLLTERGTRLYLLLHVAQQILVLLMVPPQIIGFVRRLKNITHELFLIFEMLKHQIKKIVKKGWQPSPT